MLMMQSGILNSKAFLEETKATLQSALANCVYNLLDNYFGTFVVIALYKPIQKEA